MLKVNNTSHNNYVVIMDSYMIFKIEHIDLLLSVSAISMHFFTIYITPLSDQCVVYNTSSQVSCNTMFDKCCSCGHRCNNCRVENCYCDFHCYNLSLNDCCTDVPQICNPRK